MKINKKDIKQIILVLSSFLVGGLTVLLIVMLLPRKEYTNNIVYDKTSLNSSIKKVYDSVVVIESYTGDNLETTGSGFYYKSDMKYAYILTNEHVIKGNNIMVTNTDQKKIEATVLGKDQYLDLAVLRINKKYAKKYAKFGNSEKSSLGDSIYTIGSPLGINYQGTVTSGIISGKERMVQTTVGDNSNGNWLMKVIQIDAPINHGNSGGPLLNINGEVIGICTLKFTDEEVEGMGFAIPIEYAKIHIEELEQGKKLEWPELGIKMTNISNSGTIISHDIELPEKIKEGVVVLDIKKDTNADKSDLKKGDIIVSIDNEDTKDIAYLKYELFQHKVGEEIKITFYRNGIKKTTKVKLNSSK